MTQLELAADVLKRDVEMMKMHIADFSDADMLVRPVPTANHTAWQLGHLVGAESWMVNTVSPGASAQPLAGFGDKFTKETAKLDDPKAFPSKVELLDAFSKQRDATIAWVKTLTPADLDKPTPAAMQGFVPTVGHLLSMLPVHGSMHVGQIQVIRRKLGRPVMF